MIYILLMGKDKNYQLGNFLYGELSKTFNTSYIFHNNLRQHGHGKSVAIVEFDSINTININKCIIVMKKNSRIKLPKMNVKNVISIVSSDELKQLELLSSLNIPVITCGTSKDTIGFTSKSEDSIVVAVQRAIRSFKGEEIEPLEVPIKLSGTVDEYAVMVATAIFTIVG